MKQYLKKFLALLLALTLMGTMFVATALADDPVPFDATNTQENTIKPGAQGTITVHKYITETQNAQTGTGTGSSADENKIPTGQGYEPVKNVEFRLYPIADENALISYYEGSSSSPDYSSITGSNALLDMVGVSNLENATKYVKAESGADGIAKFEHVRNGFYVLVEFDTPDQITNATPAGLSLISMPMVNAQNVKTNDNTYWLYDIHVYPKNHESRADVELTKWKGTATDKTPFEDVQFKLERYEGTGTPDATNSYLGNDSKWVNYDKTPNNTTVDSSDTTAIPELKTDSNGKIKITNLPSGVTGTFYRLTEVSVPVGSGYIVNREPIVFLVTPNNTIELKQSNSAMTILGSSAYGYSDNTVTGNKQLDLNMLNEKPTLTKTIGENGEHSESYETTDTVPYTVTVYAPNNTAELAKFEILDTLPRGMNVTGDIVVKVGDKTLVDGTDYELNTEVNGHNFEISFKDSPANATTPVGKAAISGKTVTITYNAVFDFTTAHRKDVVINGNGNLNNATLSFSNEVVVSGTPGTSQIEDEADAFTYAFDIAKYLDEVGTGHEAAGVKFELYKGNNQLYVDDLGIIDGVQTYRLAAANATTNPTNATMTTPASGKIRIEGLNDGTYDLLEVQTVQGYNLLSGKVSFTVAANRNTTWTNSNGAYVDGKQTVNKYEATTYNNSATDNGIGSTNIINKKGFILPQTGSMGYLLFCSVGLVLVLGGAMLMMSGRKRKIR